MTVGYLEWIRPSPRGEFEIQDVINQMIAAGLTAGGLVQATPREWILENDGQTKTE
jgi:dTDP-glucose pyrophosphorylase